MEAARPAVAGDLPRVAELYRQALAELLPTRGGTVFAAERARPEPLVEGFAADLADPARHVVVGTFDELAFGYAVARTDVLTDGTTIGVITDLYVEPLARQVGVGQAMMDVMLEWCAQRGCVGVDCTALPGDRDTKNFFESNGLTARLLVVHRRLDGSADAT